MSRVSAKTSRELHELSGWVPPPPERPGGWSRSGSPPAGYELGFLLTTMVGLCSDLQLTRSTGFFGEVRWRARCVPRSDHRSAQRRAPTPQDALALLAIDLFRDGTLRRSDA